MKIVFLGAGKEGKTAIKDLVESEVEEIVVGDYYKEKAETVAKKHKSKPTEIKPKQVDATQKEELIEIMEGADVVANSIGPFYEHGPRILKAAIEAGVDFIDICDDSEPTLDELDLHEEARDAGITAVIGLGNNPGTGNICAKYGVNRLDEVQEINFYWLHPASSEASSASLQHALEIFSGQVTSYQDNEWVEVSASSGKEEIEFPEPVGTVEVHNCGHPEPITVPRYIEGVDTVLCKGGVIPVWANRDLRKFIDYGLTSTEPLEVGGSSVVPRDFTKAFLESYTSGISQRLGEKASRVEVRGKKNGNKTVYKFDRIGKIWTAGISLSIGAQMVGENLIDEEGVYPPEAVVNPKKFLEEMSQRGMDIREEVEREKLSI